MRRCMRFTFVLIVFCLVFPLSSAESKILKKLGKFMPTVTESATLANMTNAYMKVADWVRATNKVVGNIRSAVADISATKDAVESIVNTARQMKEFDLYDMDSWASTVGNIHYIAGSQVSRVLHHVGMFEIHAIDGVMQYREDLDSISAFDIRDAQQGRRRILSTVMTPGSYSTVFRGSGKTRKEVMESEITNLENKKSAIIEKSTNATKFERRRLVDSLAIIERDIARLDRKIIILDGYSLRPPSKMDSIMYDAQELMAVNLVEAEVMYDMVTDFTEYAAEIGASIDRIKNNDVPSGKKSGSTPNEDYSEDLKDIEYYGDHPNQAPIPERSEDSAGDEEFGDMDKKDANTQDIISVRNAANLALLKQERILRDIEAMKANTLAYYLIVDGYKRSDKVAIVDALKFNSMKWKGLVGAL